MAVTQRTAGGKSRAGVRPAGRLGRARVAVSFRNAAAVYLLAVMFAVFALWIPGTFLTWGTWRSLLSDQAITCLAAVGLVAPIAAGVVDLAVGTEVGLGAVLVAWLLADQSMPIALAIALTLAGGGCVGVFSWLMITRAKVPSFIATLGVGSLLTAVILWVSGSEQIVNLPAGFAAVGGGQLLGLTYPVYIMLAVSAVVWYVLERTPAGRRVYATGGNMQSAALAGVRTSRVLLGALVTCGVISALAGLLESSQLSTGDPTIGPGYLLPVIAAVFLGSTQFRRGRFNVWGTVVAAYVLATGVKGLQLAGAPIWIPDLFNGAALLLAVALAAWRKPQVTRREAVSRLLRSSTPAARARARARRVELDNRISTAQSAVTGVAAGQMSAGVRPAGRLGRARAAVSFRNAAAVYLLAVMFAVFALWIPGTFLTWGTWRSLLSDQAITCLAAVGLVAPIAAGVVDLAVGTEVGLGAVLVAWLLADQSMPIALAIALTLAGGGCVGVFSWLMITRAKVPSFIATLGVGSLLTAVILWVSGSEQIVNLPAGFAAVGGGQLLGLTYPVYIMLAVSAVVWYVLERTPAGRRVYATGGNMQSAALAGVRTSRVLLGALVTCGVISALAGLLESSQLSTGDPTIGPGYLLPVIAAVFLGSTQFRRGRFNVWGTVVAAYVLATGVKGLQLAGAPIWIPDLFNGAALLLAVALAQWDGTPAGRRAAIGRRPAAARDRYFGPRRDERL